MNIRFPVWLALILALLGAPQTNRAANLLINGSFEDPPGIYPYQVFSAGEGAMPGWTIESGTVEITAGTYWQSAEGAQSLDLNGIFESIGTIHQDFATVPGQNYTVRFAYAGNPECGLPTLKTANAYWNELLLTNLSFDITGYSNTNVGWIYYEQTITATTSNSRIRFQATSPTFCGLTLDDVSVVAAPNCTAPPPDLTSWWPAEANSDDTAGQLGGTTPFGISYAPGVVGQAFDFGGGRRLSLPDPEALKLTDSLTIEAWIFVRNPGGFIVFRGDNRPGLDPYVLMVDGQSRLQFHIESLTAAVNLRTPIPLQAWQHVAATLDGSSGDMQIFINGELVADANTSVRPFRDLDAGSEPAIGIGNHGGTFHNFPFDGLIDELAIYDRALSTAEIQSLHTAGSTGKCGSTNPPPHLLSVPVITGFNPISATVGSAVTITGTNFSPAAAENIVFFGAVQATVTAASVNSLSVLVPIGATYAPITLSVSGLVAYASQPFQPTFVGNSTNITTDSFAPRFDLAGGDGAHRSVIADLDGDGKPDLTVADVYGHTISLFRNISSSGTLSNGSFAPRVVLPAEGGASDNPYGIVVADVDGDGKPDIVVCDRLGNNVSVYRNIASPGNLAAGSFAPHVNFAVGADPRYARVADLDGDGQPDIVTANYAGNTVSILRNIGSAGSLNAFSFAPAVSLPAGSGPYDIAVGDLDGDGKPDLAVVCTDGPTLSLYRNVAAPGALTADSFATRVDLEALAGNDTIALGDLDGDGKSDLIFGSFQSRTMSVYRNQSSPGAFTTSSFAPRVDFSNGNWTHSVALSDLNGDGKTDVATVGELDSYLSIYENLSTPGGFTNGSLAARVDFGAGWNAWGLSIGDLDGDGRPDLVFCNAYDDTVSIYQNVVPFTNAPPPQTNDCVAPASGLVSWWPGAQTAADVVSGNHGALGGNATFDVGMVGQGFAFDGIGDGVNLGNPASLQLQDFTIEAWIQRGSATICSLDQDLGPGGVMLSYGYGGYGFGVFDNGELFLSEIGISYVGSPLTVTDTNYHHVAVTKSGGEVVFFLDGTPAPAAAYNPTFAFTTEATIGAVSADRRNSFLGRVDELAVYSRALSAAEVAAIHAAGSLGKCITNTPPTNTCVAAPTGLVSSWRMDGDGSDSADDNDGTLLNGAGFAAGKVGQALSFDGINDHFRVADQPNLRLTNGLSVETWIFPTSLGGNHCIMSKWDAVVGPDQRSFTVGLQPDGRAFLGLSPDGIEVGATVFSTNSVPLNQWTYLAVTYDGAALRLYLNGVVQDQTPYTQGIFPGTSDIGMGANVGGTAAGDVSSPFAALFAGMIDEPGIYNRALSASEISAIYNAGSAGKCVVSNPPPPGPILAGPITNSANGHQYYLLDATNWPAAEEIAVSLGGHLVTINDAAENGWVVANFSNFGGIERPLWIGLTDQASEGNWQWISGDPSSYRNWSPIEPNNGGGYFPDEDHALIWHPSSGYPLGSWNDAPSNQVWFAVVEVGPVNPPVQPILAGPITNSANGHWYYLLTATNWPAAQQIARTLGGHLTTINDAAENNWVFLNFGNFGGVERDLWIGLTDSRLEGNWRWINGQSASYRNWASGEPNSGGGSLSDEDYAMIWNPSAYALPGSWNDAPGPQHNHGVVEIAPPVIQGPGMRMTGASGSTTNAFRLQFVGEPGQVYFIEATCDWVNWENLGVAIEIGNGSFEFIDTDAWRYPGRFYRTVSP